MTKKPIQSRVLWFNALSILAIVITEVLANDALREFFGGYIAVFMIAGSLVNAVLRLDTSKSISTRHDIPPPSSPMEVWDEALEKDDLKDF